MEVLDDEAYYWVCSLDLNWGSFHTPPMVLVFIKIGYALFHNEFGVRLLFVLAHLITVFAIGWLAKPQDVRLFIAILCSFLVMHVAGVWAAPDIPYLLFSILLIIAFDYYNKKVTWPNVLLVSMIAALLLYSKYHGVVIILSLLAANIPLFKRPSLYLIGLIALMLYMPHIYWLYEHDWVSFKFHLLQRERDGYHWYYPLHFWGGLVLITGPLIGLFLIPAAARFKPNNQLDKNLKFVLLGIISFFFILSFRNRIEANWMVATIIPLTVLGYKAALQRPRLRKAVFLIFPIMLIVAIALRIVFSYDILPSGYKTFQKVYEFHNNKKWANEIKKQAGELPVVFQSGYQRPSKYWFYSQDEKVANLTPLVSSPSHYLLLNNEVDFTGKKVFLIHNGLTAGFTPLILTNGDLSYKIIDSFQTYRQYKLILQPEQITVKAGEEIRLAIAVANKPRNQEAQYQKANLGCLLFEQGRLINSVESDVDINAILSPPYSHTLTIVAPKEKGVYKIYPSLFIQYLSPSVYGDPCTLIVQ